MKTIISLVAALLCSACAHHPLQPQSVGYYSPVQNYGHGIEAGNRRLMDAGRLVDDSRRSGYLNSPFYRPANPPGVNFNPSHPRPSVNWNINVHN